MPDKPAYYLGIDTGGTYTDGVLLDPQTRRVVKSAKVLTTHHDLKLCIAGVLDALVGDEEVNIGLVSLSTTLATNAIAEGKSKPVALFLLGYDPELVRQFGFEKQFGTRHHFYIEGRHDLRGVELNPLDEQTISDLTQSVMEQVDAFAVSSYAGPLNSSHEERSLEIISDLTGRPVVLAHHLSSNLDSIRRATTARLNASLLSEAHEFVQAAQEMLTRRGLTCPLMMVRGDGSLVRASYASRRPVEIIHSGPATSVIGGHFLAGVEKALVIDMGGTTTDMALVDHGKMTLHGEATVGSFHTSVKTIHARSFGLGGDSQIHFDSSHQIHLGPGRVLPLSYLSYHYPEIRKDLKAWLSERPRLLYSDRLECWRLRREPTRPFDDPRTQKALELLRSGPQRLTRILKYAGAVSAVQVDRDLLTRQDIIERCGLTPTDLLHVTGEFSAWDAEIAQMAVEAVARTWGISPDAFIDQIKQRIANQVVSEIVQFLSGTTLSDPFTEFRRKDLGNWLFDENLSQQNEYLGCQIHLKLPIVGIGAPAKIFLPLVAQILGTQIIFPNHYQVANAVGTVVGSVLVRHEGEVTPAVEGQMIVGYFARANNHQIQFPTQGEALDYVRKTLTSHAESEAISAGAHRPIIELEEREPIPGIFYLSACAVGKPEPEQT